MSNPVLRRWEEEGRREGPAVLAASGETLRTWGDVSSEAVEHRGELCRGMGAVALQTGNHASFPALLLACWQAGRAACLCEPELPEPVFERLAIRLGITVRVRVCGGAPVFQSTGCPAKSASGIDLYKLTSGTVAEPEPIAFTAAQLLADADQVCATMGLGREDRNFGVISFAHSYGFSNLVTPLIACGIPMVVSTDPLPRAIQSGLASARASVLPAVPAIFRSLLACDGLPESLRLCISAGAPLDPGLGKAFHDRFGRKIHSFYGASECGGICYDASDGLPTAPGFVGQPLRGVTISCGAGPSKILVRSPAVGVRTPAGLFEPSDLLVREAEGFRIVGRESDILNIAGRKVSPGEVEGVIKTCAGVEDAVVCGVDDPARGQEICALIVGEAATSEIRRHCAEALPAWKIPRRMAFAPAIPVNSRGKTSRAAIADAFFSGSE